MKIQEALPMDVPLPMIIFDAVSLRILYVNKHACELYQYSEDEFLGLTLSDIRPEESRENFVTNVAPIIAARVGGHTLMTRHMKKNGEVMDIELFTQQTRFAGVPARVIMLKDMTQRIREHTELTKARSTLRSVLDSSLAGISAVDTEHRLIACNAFVSNIIREHYGVDVVEGMKLREFLPEDVGTFFHESETRALAGETFTAEWTFHLPSADMIVEFSFYPMYEGNTISGASSFGKDLTQIRNAEAEQRKLFDESPMPMWVIDTHTLKFLRVNKPACALYEYSEAEFLQLTPLELRQPADRDEYYQQTISQIRHLPDEEPVHTRHMKKSGSVMDVIVKHHKMMFEGREARIALIEDISERLKAETALRLANERFRLATEAVSCVIYDWDVNSGYVYNSPGLLPLTGFDPEVEPNCASLAWWMGRIHPDDKQEAAAIIERALAQGREFEAEYRVLHKQGHYVYVWDRGIISRDEAGVAVRVVGSTQDITARKRMEAQLVEERNHALTAQESAEEMSVLKTNFLANMSHEIRTPLTAILGFAELLSANPIDPVRSRHASIIHSSATRLLETINNILDLARTESRKILLSPTVVSINDELERLVDLLEPLASQRSVGLHFIPSSQPTEAFLDSQYLSQIVTNLLGNAIKFTHEGFVNVYLHMGAEALLPMTEIRGFPAYRTSEDPLGEHFRIVVSDTGVGIAQDQLSMIFDEFKQESTGYDRSHEGSGLGLTISNRLVAAMGGSMEVRSAKGAGSTFIVRLPYSSAVAPNATLPPAAPAPKRRLLLVENNLETAEMIRYMLRAENEVEHASSAGAALLMLGSERPDMILMDVNLGSGMSGLDLTRILRGKKETATIPIIGITGYAMKTDQRAVLEAGCDDYLSKPFTQSELHSVVERNLRLV